MPTESDVEKARDAAAGELQKTASNYLARKRSAAAADAEFVPDGAPMLDLHSSFDRGALLTSLRLARSSDILTMDDIKKLLCDRGIGMSDHAASQVREQLFGAFGASVTMEQLVCLLVPIQRVRDFADLTESEVSMMRSAFAKLPGATGGATAAVSTDFLKRAAREVPGLQPSGLMSATELDAVHERCLALHDGSVDLASLFNISREVQRAQLPPPTQHQLVKTLAAFDTETNSTLPLEKLRDVIKLFDGIEVRATIPRPRARDIVATVAVETRAQPTLVCGFRLMPNACARASQIKSAVNDAKTSHFDDAKGAKGKAMTRVNYHILVERFLALRRKAKALQDQGKEEKKGGFFGWLGGGGGEAKKAPKATPVVKPSVAKGKGSKGSSADSGADAPAAAAPAAEQPKETSQML